eukprot:SAG31_NODE_10562_length_1124_cov_1.375610_1_plen_71_part_00
MLVLEHSSLADATFTQLTHVHLTIFVASGVPEAFWPDITIKTQRVVDAIQKSWQSGGTKVHVAPMNSPNL